MNLRDAIDILKIFHDKVACSLDATETDAFQLGIEAIEFKLALRRAKHPHGKKLLPSETD